MTGNSTMDCYAACQRCLVCRSSKYISLILIIMEPKVKSLNGFFIISRK